jgi:hypothetical protein
MNGRADYRNDNPMRLVNLEALVCDLLQTNQRLREELASSRRRTIANGIGQADDFAAARLDSRSGAS